VLIFASDTCASCAEEAKYWKEYFSSKKVSNVYFAHILIGGVAEDAQDWKDYHEVPWDVLIEPEDNLFRKYCPEIRTPCMLILDREKGQLTQTFERLKQNQVEEFTSPWRYEE